MLKEIIEQALSEDSLREAATLPVTKIGLLPFLPQTLGCCHDMHKREVDNNICPVFSVAEPLLY
jgi:hypothetical protein